MFRTGALLLVAAIAIGLGVRYLPDAVGSPQWVGIGAGLGNALPGPDPTVPPKPRPTLAPLAIRPVRLTLPDRGLAEWAMLDRRTGRIYGSAGMAEPNNTASLVKAWIAADYLRRRAVAGEEPTPARLEQLRVMIRDSDNEAAIELYEVLGGLASGKRMMTVCKLSDGTPSGNWSVVRLSARDVAKLGGCIASGRAAGPRWTSWLLGEMRQVRGVGDFGVRDAFSGNERDGIAIKNGWIAREETGLYEVNCLAIGDRWAVGVVNRYPAELDITYGAELCRKVGAALRV
ncbi:hypothetical protein GCM10010123_26390 [Pilimelia anulata]|uniref:Uncharacterized protein n=1 Tax=Pilimelia anulata TaxID=53371 RepID=A0A8J3B7M9_9ACTN|nr:hypothetical protein GCM10010123_26390 [Pilimelia anulata]